MSNMSAVPYERLTVDRLVRAAEQTRIKPISGQFCDVTDDGQRCGCGITIAYAALFPYDIPEESFKTRIFANTFESIIEKLGLPYDYASGFMFGFDNYDKPPQFMDDDMQAGFEDGKAAQKHFFGGGDV